MPPLIASPPSVDILIRLFVVRTSSSHFKKNILLIEISDWFLATSCNQFYLNAGKHRRIKARNKFCLNRVTFITLNYLFILGEFFSSFSRAVSFKRHQIKSYSSVGYYRYKVKQWINNFQCIYFELLLSTVLKRQK